MFATLRPGQETLQQIEHSRRFCPPGSTGPSHDACVECRAKKLKCSGEKSGCQRCISQDKLCTYVGNRYTRKKETSNQRASSSGPCPAPGPAASLDAAVNPAKPESGGAKRPLSIQEEQRNDQDIPRGSPGPEHVEDTAMHEGGRADQVTQSNHNMPHDEELGWPQGSIGMGCDLLYEEFAMRGPDPTPPYDIDALGSFGLQDLIAVGQQNPLPAPDRPSSRSTTRSHTALPQSGSDGSLLHAMRPKANIYALPSPQSSVSHRRPRSRTGTALPLSDPGHFSRAGSTMATRRTDSRYSPIQRGHACTSHALRHLEVACRCPKRQSQPEKFLRFFGNLQRGAKDLARLSGCLICSKSSPYLMLLAIVVDKYTDAVAAAVHDLSSADDRQASELDAYGVETGEEFGQLFSPILLPCIVHLVHIVRLLQQRYLEESLEAPFDDFREVIDKLRVVQKEIQDQISSSADVMTLYE